MQQTLARLSTRVARQHQWVTPHVHIADDSTSERPTYDGNDGSLITVVDVPSMNDQYCIIPTSFTGITVGDQVRVIVNGVVAIFTVSKKSADDGIVKLNGADRLGVKPGSTTVSAQLLGPCVVCPRGTSAVEAKTSSELTESIQCDDAALDDFICIAPHGGDIDLKSDLQAERVHRLLSGTTLWMCKGYKQGGGAFKQWHVTSNDISPNSFPLLKKLVAIDEKRFKHCVAFHGMSKGGVLIGGRGSLELKLALQKAIQEKINDETVTVKLATAKDPCNGLNERNIVNWITKDGKGGIQIEQDRIVRRKYWRSVADAVIEVYSTELGIVQEDTMLGGLY